ncbi:LOW QUALITY PROTEIN: hypothetical protein PHMEG_00020002 [Phytophthora megakarya]|uniref:Ubiquitin-like protease family profile domain-containing protein n=1 Tax=Phytophthora megakarya TaxID=4795 RepID=A0A225VQI6_9STRA|nr:LOW QUALITY PROTEIN: hypothetical protein PHMEG_00020002 [Phytophthora megakarya]
MLWFVIQQWCDIRQGLQTSTQAPVTGATSTRTASGPIDNLEKSRRSLELAVLKVMMVKKWMAREENLAKKEAITTRLNPKARKKKKTAASERADRKWYETSENGCNRAGQSTLKGLLASLDREQPGLWEAQRRLSGIVVKFTEYESKKPKFRSYWNLVMEYYQYRILKQPQYLWTMTLPSVVKHRMWSKKSATELGIELHKWLNEEGLPAPSAEYHELIFKVSADVLSARTSKLEGLPNLPDFKYTLLYRATPPTWLTDAAIHACCERLVQDFPVSSQWSPEVSGRGTMIQAHSKKQRDFVFFQQVQEPGVETVLLPLNFMNAHWCCVIVKVNAKRILYYDPLDQDPYMKAAADVCTYLKVSGLSVYDVVAKNNPIQFGAFSCGVYAFYARVDMTASALSRRRFELFFSLKTGRLLPLEGEPTMALRDGDDGGKSAPPSQDVDEQLQPTQMAE